MRLDAGIGVANTMMASKAGEETCSLGNTRNITNVDELMNSVNCEDPLTTSDYAYIYVYIYYDHHWQFIAEHAQDEQVLPVMSRVHSLYVRPCRELRHIVEHGKGRKTLFLSFITVLIKSLLNSVYESSIASENWHYLGVGI